MNEEWCDLRFEDDDLVIEGGDFALATGVDVLKQDIYDQIRVAHFAWALNFLFGSRVTEYINMPDDPMKMVQLKKDIITILRRDKRVVSDSWEIKLSDDVLEIKFLPVGRKEPVILTLEAT
jgi:hypothetical protein